MGLSNGLKEEHEALFSRKFICVKKQDFCIKRQLSYKNKVGFPIILQLNLSCFKYDRLSLVLFACLKGGLQKTRSSAQKCWKWPCVVLGKQVQLGFLELTIRKQFLKACCLWSTQTFLSVSAQKFQLCVFCDVLNSKISESPTLNLWP